MKIGHLGWKLPVAGGKLSTPLCAAGDRARSNGVLTAHLGRLNQHVIRLRCCSFLFDLGRVS